MRSLYRVAMECVNEVEAAGIEHGDIVEFSINTRAKTRFGQCKRRNGKFYIDVSVSLMDENVPMKSLKNTLVHEILHTCDGCLNHGNKWKVYAEKMNKMYGYNISRANTAEEMGVSVEDIEKNYKYVYKCDGCGQTIKRMRASNFTKYPFMYSCGECGGNFSRI